MVIIRPMKVEHVAVLADAFPSTRLYKSVCEKGLSVIRPLASPPADDVYGWNYGSARPPSYSAYGRLRALMTLQKARQLLGKAPGRVLEVAAGDGALCACLAMDGHHVSANDLLEENLRRAVSRFRNGSDIRLLPGNLFDLDAAELGRFDLVIACEIIEHVAHSIDFLKKLKSFLAPGGVILLTTPNGAFFRNKLPTYSDIGDFTALEKLQFKPDADGHLFLITTAEMSQIAGSAGLRTREVVLWGTPFITGESGFRYLAPLLPASAWYALERWLGHCGKAVMNTAANAMCVVLSSDSV